VLREADLAAEFKVSRTPIRTVLQRLAFGGLIESRDGVGTIVTTLTFEELRDIYEMRLKIAELIGHMSPRACTPQHLTTMDGLLRRAGALTRHFDLTEYWRINHDLHFLIGDLIGNRALRRMWDQLYFQAARIWYGLASKMAGEMAASLVEELSEVRKAMAENDVVAVGYIQRNHIAFGLRRVLQHHKAAPG
jgi:DNA-binding GntR family transcriptional regulator